MKALLFFLILLTLGCENKHPDAAHPLGDTSAQGEKRMQRAPAPELTAVPISIVQGVGIRVDRNYNTFLITNTWRNPGPLFDTVTALRASIKSIMASGGTTTGTVNIQPLIDSTNALRTRVTALQVTQARFADSLTAMRTRMTWTTSSGTVNLQPIIDSMTALRNKMFGLELRFRDSLIAINKRIGAISTTGGTTTGGTVTLVTLGPGLQFENNVLDIKR